MMYFVTNPAFDVYLSHPQHPVYSQNNNVDYLQPVSDLPIAIYTCDVRGVLTSYNEKAAELWGQRPVVGQEFWSGAWKIFEPDGTPVPPDQCPSAVSLKTGKAVVGKEIIIETPAGKRHHIVPHCQLMRDEKGNVTGVVAMLEDISRNAGVEALETRVRELSGTVEALRRSEERYQRMISEVQDYAIILLSKDGIIESWNAGAERIKGYTAEEIKGKSFRIFYTEEDRRNGLPDRLLGQALEEGLAHYEGWRVRKDGSRFWGGISMTALHDSTGQVVGFSKVTRDLTERRENEMTIRKYVEDLRMKNEMLHESEERYHLMVSEVEDYAIMLLNVDGYIQNWNKGAEKIKGYSAGEVIGQHFSIFYSLPDRKKGIPQMVLEIARSKGKAVHEGWRLRKDGSMFWGSIVMTRLHNKEGALIGFTKVTRDLTEKKTTDEKLMAATVKLAEKNKELERKNEELSSFAYISSHDLQEPLRKIQTFSDRVLELEYNNLSEKGRDYFDRIQRGAERMQKLIRDILAYSRANTADKKLETSDLNEILTQAKNELEIQMQEKKAVVESASLPTLKVIPFQIQQMFNNLLSNALKFSRPGVAPHIRVQAEEVSADSLKPAVALNASQYWHISFSDNGIGFDPVYEKRIFEVFQRLHDRMEYGGTGIGLAICKKIVENHHGMITATGIPNQGATFDIYLPVLK